MGFSEVFARLKGADRGTTASLEATVTAIDGNHAALDVNVLSAGGSGLTDAQLRASAVPVSGTFFQATQPVSLATNTPDVTDRAARLLGHVTVDAAPTTAVTGPLTDAQLRATPVPVSGTVTANAGTNLNTSALALDATLTGGTAKAINRGGAKGTTVAADVTSNPVDANTQALHVDGSKVTQPVSIAASVAVTGPLTDAQLRATAVPVSGTVTANAGTNLNTSALALDATLTGGTQKSKLVDTAGTNVASVSAAGALKVDNSAVTQPVSGTFFQATQPVSAASLPLPTGASTETTLAALNTKMPAAAVTADALANPTVTQMGALNEVWNGTTWDRAKGDATNGQLVRTAPATLVVTGTAAAAAGVTVTLAAAGAGLFHYITRINIIKYASVATVGAAAPTVITSTNLPGSVAWTLPTALAIGTQYETDVEPASPIKSSAANTATTIVAAGLASIIYRITVYYYTGP